MLAQQLKELSLLELDFDLEVTGFYMGEIDLRIEGLASGAQNREDPADILEGQQAGPPVTQPGDGWLLNNHHVYCGSALEQAAFSLLMQGSKAAMVFIDPPYNIRIEGNVSGLGTIHHREFIMASGEMSEAEFTEFLRRAFAQLARHTVNGSVHFVCMDWRHLQEILAAGRRVYDQLLNVCVWAKDNAGMGSFYRSTHEFVFVFRNGRGPHRNNIQLGQYGRNRTNVWRYPGANSFARHSDEGNLLAVHPTVEPVQLVVDAILDCSARGDIVIDSFLGSGTSVIAAERTGRRCYGLELDPTYVDAIVRRWQRFTGVLRVTRRAAEVSTSSKGKGRTRMPTENDSTYEVGYGKPPQRTQFKKGESGNLKGRPKGVKNLASLFEKELNERLLVSENGRRRTISKREAMVKHLVNKAVSGDKRLMQLLLEEIRLIESRTSSPGSDSQIFDEADRQVIVQLQERIRRLVKTEGDDDETASG